LTAGAGNPESEKKTEEQLMAERISRAAMNDQAEEVSVEELFRELCVRGRDYMQLLLKDEELT
jgi:hypothetical protein